MATVLILMAFGFGVMYSSFTLFLIHELGFSNQAAFSLYSTYISWFFTASIVGGLFGGRWGHREAVWIGCCLLFFAYLFFCYAQTLYLACALLDLGMGFFFPNVMVVVGHATRDNHKNTSGNLGIAYILLYLSVNTGVFFGGLAAGFCGIDHFVYLFALSAFFILLSFALFLFVHPRIIFASDSQSAAQVAKKYNLAHFCLFIMVTLLLVEILYFLLQNEKTSNYLVLGLGLSTLCFLAILSFFKQAGLSFVEQKKLKWVLVIMITTLIFWALYNLEQSLVLAFFDQWVSKKFLGMVFLSSYLGSFNALCDIVIGVLLMTKLKNFSERINNESKIFAAIFIMGSAYLVMAFGIYLSIATQENSPLSMTWVLLAFFMMSVSEMIVGPLSNALAIEYGPKALQGFLIGFSQLISGVSGTLSDYLARLGASTASMTRIESLSRLLHAFLIDAGLGMGVGLVLLLGYRLFRIRR